MKYADLESSNAQLHPNLKLVLDMNARRNIFTGELMRSEQKLLHENMDQTNVLLSAGAGIKEMKDEVATVKKMQDDLLLQHKLQSLEAMNLVKGDSTSSGSACLPSRS